MVAGAALTVAALLLCASGGLFYAHHFIHGQVVSQLGAEKIMFPAAGSSALQELPTADAAVMDRYAGRQLTTGAQAEVFADHYIAAHLAKIGGGKTYSELGSASIAQPGNTVLKARVDTVFRGEMLRGMLLNAYAFDTMAVVADYAAWGALAVAAALIVLAAAYSRTRSFAVPSMVRSSPSRALTL